MTRFVRGSTFERYLVTFAALVVSASASAQQTTPQTPPVQICSLGDLKLESGSVIPNFRMSYITFGTLNADKNNAVLSLHGLRGNRTSQTIWAGPGKAFDTERYFVVQPDTLGVVSLDPNATTSPTRSGMNMTFPRFTVRDMVAAEYRMLTECLGVRHLAAVTGTSMGGMETYQWAVSYPDFMDAVVPMVPQPKTTRQGNDIWELARQVIMLDPKWRDGNYSNDDPPRAGIGMGVSVQEAFGASSPWFEEQYATKEDVHKALAANEAAIGNNVQARDWVYRTWAIESHNIGDTRGFNGNVDAATKSIKARVLMFVNCYDQLLVSRESGNFQTVQLVPTAKLMNINDIVGHSGTGTTVSQALITAEVRDLMDRISKGKPGIRGARLPRGWNTLEDVCGSGS